MSAKRGARDCHPSTPAARGDVDGELPRGWMRCCSVTTSILMPRGSTHAASASNSCAYPLMSARHGACNVGSHAARTAAAKSSYPTVRSSRGRERLVCVFGVGVKPPVRNSERIPVGHEHLPHFRPRSRAIESVFFRMRVAGRVEQPRGQPGSLGGRASRPMHTRLQRSDLRFGSCMRRELRLLRVGPGLR